MNSAYLFSSKNLTLVLIFITWLCLVLMIIGKNASMHYAVMDLGVSTHTLFGINDLKEYSRMFFGHIQPFLFLYAKVWSIFFKSSLSILLLQLFLLILPTFWIYKKFNHISVIAYLLYFPLWFNALFDFHIDHLSIPLLFGFFISIANNKYIWALVFSIVLSFVKEIFILQTIVCAIYIIFHSYETKNLNFTVLLSAISTFIFGIFYFSLALKYLTTEYQSFGLNSEAFSWLGTSIYEIVIYSLTHLKEILIDIFHTPRKMLYLFAIFAALGFIPLLNLGPLLIAMPILAVSLLSNYEGYYGLGHHYSAGLIAPLIVSFYGGLPKAKAIWKKIGISYKWFTPFIISILLIAHIVLSPSPISRLFWSEKIWSYSYKAYIPNDRDKILRNAINTFIPDDPDLVLSVQNTLNLDSLMKRRLIMLFPEGIKDEKLTPYFSQGFLPIDVEWKYRSADYVLIDKKRPWFIRDQGCEWYYGRCTDKDMEAKFNKWLAITKTEMEIIFEQDGFIIFKRALGKS